MQVTFDNLAGNTKYTIPSIQAVLLRGNNVNNTRYENAVSGVQVGLWPIQFDLPLLERLFHLDEEVGKKLPLPSRYADLSAMGLMLNDRLEPTDYWCSPINSVCFGRTGGGGTHFNFLVADNRIDHNSPVLVTVPENFLEPYEANMVLGRNLEDFIRLGLHCGFFSMEQFSFNPQWALEHYACQDWDESWFPSEYHRIVAEYVSDFFRLKRLVYTPSEFNALQMEYRPLMKFRKS